ncbi:MAG: nuclear transport factor 2 family protein [Thermoleophilia bacterium]
MTREEVRLGAGDDGLREITDRMHREEQRGAEGVPFFAGLLDEDLRFRRASGMVVTRDHFLHDLARPDNRRTRIEAVADPGIQVLGDRALVQVMLAVEGSDGDTPVDGVYLNIRVFERDGPGPWALTVWFNERVGDIAPPAA